METHSTWPWATCVHRHTPCPVSQGSTDTHLVLCNMCLQRYTTGSVDAPRDQLDAASPCHSGSSPPVRPKQGHMHGLSLWRLLTRSSLRCNGLCSFSRYNFT